VGAFAAVVLRSWLSGSITVLNASELSFASVDFSSASAAKNLLHTVQDLYASLPGATQVAAFAATVSPNV